MTKTVFVLCRVELMPVLVHGAAKRPCVDCSREVWVSPAGQRLLETRPMPVACEECAAARMGHARARGEPEAGVGIARESIEEAEAVLGRKMVRRDSG